MDSDYSYCIGSEQSAWKGLAILFSSIVENTWETVANADAFSTLTPQTAPSLKFD